MFATIPGLAEPPEDCTAKPALTQINSSSGSEALGARDLALVEVGRQLRQAGYRFTTITPASHRRVVSRASHSHPTLRDVFGWSLPFDESDLPDSLWLSLQQSGVVEASGDKVRSGVRFSSLGDQLYAHSAFPTEQADAVFFGPDTYRFARAIRHNLRALAPRSGMRVLDVGAGSGAGGLYAAHLLRQHSPEILLADINHQALRFSRINAALNDMENVAIVESDLYAATEGRFDLIVSNPPYLVDPLARTYRHGGGEFGGALSLRIVEEGIERLAPGGQLLLYTGSAIVEGIDLLHERLRQALSGRNVTLSYDEIDPDVFGEELDDPPYDRADRIAVVAATIQVR
jgi:release factor glutamine methyltransferase